MKILFLIIISLFSTIHLCIGQSTAKINKLIEDLSWNSIEFRQSYHSFFAGNDETSYELYKIGKPAAELLYSQIGNPEKTAIIHIILTQIFEPNRNYFLPCIDIYSCTYINKMPKQRIGWHFIFNGLVWERSKEGYDSIHKDQIEKIKLLWDLRLHGKSNPFDLDIDSLIKEIHSRDSEQYPCFDNKIYANNSLKIDASELASLIGTRYPSPFFDNILKKLGNDSISFHSERNYSNISYISYLTDGIDFDFDENNILRAIFLNPIYKGTLFNGLNMSDAKEEIISKLGQPEQFINVPRYKYDWIFKRYNMLIAFGKTNRIIDLQLNNGINP